LAINFIIIMSLEQSKIEKPPESEEKYIYVDFPENFPEKIRDFILDKVQLVYQEYPEMIDRLNDLRFSAASLKELYYGDEKIGGFPLAYNAVDHKVYLNKDFNILEEMERSKSPLEKIRTEQNVIHELMHAISYRKIEEGEPYLYCYSGVQFSKGRGKVVKERKREVLNEAITNEFTFDILRKKIIDPEEREIIEYSEAISPGIRLFKALDNLIGRVVLFDAYFEGKIEELYGALEQKGINPRKLLGLIEKQNYKAAAEILEKKAKKQNYDGERAAT